MTTAPDTLGLPGLNFIGDADQTALKDKVVKPSGYVVNKDFLAAPISSEYVLYGTHGDGLIIQRPDGFGGTEFVTKTTADGLGSNFIGSVFVDSDGTIWAGCYHPEDFNQGGLSVSRDFGETWETFKNNGIYDPLQRNRLPKVTGMRTNNIRDIARDRLTNKLLLATDDGVHVVRAVSNNILPMDIELSQDVNDEIEIHSTTAFNGLGSNDVFEVLVEEVSVETVRTSEPTIRTVWYAGTSRGLSRSQDQGATWKTFDMSSDFIDINGPALVFITPNDGDTITGSMDITVQAVDDTTVKSVEISFDNQNFFQIPATAADPSQYFTTYDTRVLENGRVFLTARATDLYGNVSQAVLVLNIENPEPLSDLRIEIEEPVENSVISGVFDVRIRVVADVAIAAVEITDDPPATADRTFFPTTLVVAPRLIPGSLTLFESYYTFEFDTTSIQSGDTVQLTARVTNENGEQQEDTSTFMIYNRLPDIQAVAVRGHTIWSGTTNSCGLTLSKDNQRTSVNFTTDDGLSNNNVQAIAIRNNDVWVGTANGLNLTSDEGETWTQFSTIEHNLPGQDVRHIAFQGTVMWVATTNGVGRLDDVNQPFTVFRTSEGLPDNQVNHIFVDCDLISVWIATNNGVAMTRDQGLTWSVFQTSTGLASNMTNAITRYKGNIYVATIDGLSITNDGGVRFFNIKAPSIGSDWVLSLAPVGNDLWIGTMPANGRAGGLTILEGENGRFTTYRREGVFSSIGQQLSNTNIGLKSNTINFITQ